MHTKKSSFRLGETSRGVKRERGEHQSCKIRIKNRKGRFGHNTARRSKRRKKTQRLYKMTACRLNKRETTQNALRERTKRRLARGKEAENKKGPRGSTIMI